MPRAHGSTPRRPQNPRRRRRRGGGQYRAGARGNRADCWPKKSAELNYVVPVWSTPERERLVERLARWTPPGLNRFFFTSGGSEAVEAALKFALMYHKVNGRPQQKENNLARGSPITAIRSAALSVGGKSRAAPTTSTCCSIGRKFRPRIATAVRGTRPIPDAISNAPTALEEEIHAPRRGLDRGVYRRADDGFGGRLGAAGQGVLADDLPRSASATTSC